MEQAKEMTEVVMILRKAFKNNRVAIIGALEIIKNSLILEGDPNSTFNNPPKK